MKEVALVLAIGNLIALNLIVVGLLFIAYRNSRPRELEPEVDPAEADTHIWRRDVE